MDASWQGTFLIQIRINKKTFSKFQIGDSMYLIKEEKKEVMDRQQMC